MALKTSIFVLFLRLFILTVAGDENNLEGWIERQSEEIYPHSLVQTSALVSNQRLVVLVDAVEGADESGCGQPQAPRCASLDGAFKFGLPARYIAAATLQLFPGVYSCPKSYFDLSTVAEVVAIEAQGELGAIRMNISGSASCFFASDSQLQLVVEGLHFFGPEGERIDGNGGAIRFSGKSLSFRNSEIVNSHRAYAAALYVVPASNIYVDIQLTNISCTNCSSDNDGGAVVLDSSQMTVHNAMLADIYGFHCLNCSAGGDGGGLFLNVWMGNVTHTTFDGTGSSNVGGCIVFSGTSLTIKDMNATNVNGDVVFGASGNIIIHNTNIFQVVSRSGALNIITSGNVTISQMVIEESTSYAVAMNNPLSTLILMDSVVRFCRGIDGGAVMANGKAFVSKTLFSEN
eukprot:TRINITY_DN18903_c0_g1_i1.p1 TRINITY_DN18903_c0_g1~~TRINITY_DN18903_c0_g1_i1.p1  ORF type:complete len:403 (+),score=98.34 TRINITY_DN18903_c0_g1_i1:174-1382(+)